MKLSLAPMRCSTSITGRFVAIAARVANATESTVATNTSSSKPIPPARTAPAMARMRSTKPRWSSRLAPWICSVSVWRSCTRSGAAPDAIRTTISRGTGRSSSCRPVPSHGSSRRDVSSFEYGRTSTTPADRRAMAAALATSHSMSPPGLGWSWMVTSRPTSACHSLAAARTSMTAPVVNEARKVMMATTATKARPAIVACGTIGVSKRGSDSAGGAADASNPRDCSASIAASFIDMQATFVQHETTCVELIHQRDVVGGDDDRRPGFVELDEQAQQPLREIGIDIARRFVREQKLRPRDHRARDRRTLLFSAGEHRRQRRNAIAEPHPVQELHDLIAIAVLGMPDHPQRQRHVFIGRHVIEQAKILEHDPDAPPQRRQRILAQRRDVMAEQRDQPARRPQREEQETQQRALAGAGGAGEELERTGVDAEGEVAQDLGTEAIAQSYMLEPDHVPLPPRTPPRLLLPSPPTSHNGRHDAICSTCQRPAQRLDSGFIAAPRPFHAALLTATNPPRDWRNSAPIHVRPGGFAVPIR